MSRVRTPAASGGFTLVEMLAALAIIAMVAATAIPLLRPPSKGLRIDASARSLCAALRSTRARAIATNSEMALVIDIARKTYRSPGISEMALPPDAAVEMIVADSQREGPTRGGFLFFPSGGSSGGEVTLSISGKRAKISVNWLTGEARCEIA
jgi:general secretion pathway protein H